VKLVDLEATVKVCVTVLLVAYVTGLMEDVLMEMCVKLAGLTIQHVRQVGIIYI
jgi:hypothetical protein